MDSYAASDEGSWVRVIVKVKGLKTKNVGFFSSKKEAANAEIKPDFRDSSLSVSVKKKDGESVDFSKNLPHKIDPDSSYVEPGEDRVVIWLKKADTGQSWKAVLDRNGLEDD